MDSRLVLVVETKICVPTDEILMNDVWLRQLLLVVKTKVGVSTDEIPTDADTYSWLIVAGSRN